jgi:hypothetical protein
VRHAATVQELAVATAQVTAEGLGHEVLTDCPGQTGNTEGEEKAASEHAGVGVTAGVVQRIVREISAKGREQNTEHNAEVFVFFHLGDIGLLSHSLKEAYRDSWHAGQYG